MRLRIPLVTYLCSLWALISCHGALAAPWSVGIDERDGLPTLSVGGAIALSSRFVFWGSNWAWANVDVRLKIVAPYQYSFAGRNDTLNFDLGGRVTRPSTQTLAWEINLDAASSASSVMGGGISFRFDLANFSRALGEPELIPGNRGWTWGRPGGTRVEMRFEPPLPAVQFARGGSSEVWAFFYRGEIRQGRQRYIATLDVSADVAIAPTMAERLGLDDSSTWPAGIFDWRRSPVDLSFLNAREKPAGKRGLLQVHGDSLRFEDGTPARFWGTNLTAYALFGTSKEGVRQQARRLSEQGFNLIRMVHHDSDWVNPNVIGDRKTRDSPTLNATAMDKLDWWVKCLKDEGIYVWLDLHVGRQLKAGDRIDAFDDISQGKASADLRGYNYVNASIREAMKYFNEAYLNHANGYTGMRYKNDPAIAVVLITNENDVTNHFGNALLGDKGVPRHTALYMTQARSFASKHGLPMDKVWRSWEHGPSKLFLNDLEQRFNAEMIAHLRALGVKVPIVTTNTWGFGPLSSLPALTAGSMIDAHSGGGAGELLKNPLYAANFVHWIAAAQVSGKPVSVTEWGVEVRGALAPDRHTMPLYVAASASLQGWDAVMLYAYSQESFDDRPTPSIYHAYNDPGLMSTLPAAALLYRQGHVREALTTYVFAPEKDMMFNQPISPANSIALRTAAEKGKLMVAMPQTAELPWLEKSTIPSGARVITDPGQPQIISSAQEVVSDSGELRRNWGEGTFTVDTPRTQAAMGWVGRKTIFLADVEIAMATQNATVAVQSLDGMPIRQSRRIMISLGTRSEPTAGGQMPFRSEPVKGTLSIAAPQGLRLQAWDSRTGRMRNAEATYKGGRYFVILKETLRSYWLLLAAEP